MLVLWVVLGAVYLAVLITFGAATLRNGHAMMFILGLFFPILWVVGALIEPTPRAAAGPQP
jgi:hypothetical protein